MIGFAQSWGWLALAALALPIVIHLVRRQAMREIRFAALEWLAARSPPRRQWRLDDRVLLAVRLLLIALLAALLAEPYRHLPGDPQQHVVHVAPGIEPAAAHAAVDAPLADWRWLAAGSPPLDQPAPPSDPTAFASLIRALDRQLPAATRLSVVVQETLSGLDGERLRLGRDIDWRIVATERATPLPEALREARPLAIAIRITADTPAAAVARALVAAWRAAGASITVDVAAPGPALAADTALLIVADPILDAATQAACDRGLRVLAGAATAEADRGDLLLSTADGEPLLYRRAVGRGSVFTLAGALDAAAWPALRDPGLPLRLLPLLQAPVPPPDRAPAASVAPLRASNDATGPATPLAPWLALAIAGLALIERLLASRRHGEPA